MVCVYLSSNELVTILPLNNEWCDGKYSIKATTWTNVGPNCVTCLALCTLYNLLCMHSWCEPSMRVSEWQATDWDTTKMTSACYNCIKLLQIKTKAQLKQMRSTLTVSMHIYRYHPSFLPLPLPITTVYIFISLEQYSLFIHLFIFRCIY